MTPSTYADFVKSFIARDSHPHTLALGVLTELGEFRHETNRTLTSSLRSPKAVHEELGDVLWYLTALRTITLPESPTHPNFSDYPPHNYATLDEAILAFLDAFHYLGERVKKNLPLSCSEDYPRFAFLYGGLASLAALTYTTLQEVADKNYAKLTSRGAPT